MNLYQVMEIAPKIFQSYKAEILKEEDWFFNLDDWTLNFVVFKNFNCVEVCAYEVYDNETLWEDRHCLDDIELEEVTA